MRRAPLSVAASHKPNSYSRFKETITGKSASQIKGYNPQQEVVSALGDIVPATLVSFTVQVKPPAANSVPGKIGVTYLVDANTLSAEDTSGGKRLNAVFYATIYSPAGKMLTNNSQKVDHVFDAGTMG